MEYRQVGASGPVLSELGLGGGSATFVGRVDDETAVSIVHHALDLGITYFDTAETYAEGRGERILGQALAGRRDDVVIATKFGKDRSVGPGEAPGSRRNVMRRVEESLRRLATDYIDLYVFHMPDPRTPAEETLGALADLVRAGKVREVGCSDFTAAQLNDTMSTARSLGSVSFVTAGAEYNILRREAERELVPLCREQGIGLVPTFPLAGGFLAGKYRPGVAPTVGSRFGTVPAMANAKFQNLSRYDGTLSAQNFAALSVLETFAADHGHAVSDLALAWLLAHDEVAAVPVGVTSADQLDRNVAGLGWRLDGDDLLELDRRLELPADASHGLSRGATP